MRFGFRELVFVIVLMAMPVAAYFLAFQPRNAQIAAARQEIRLKQTKLQQLEAATRAIDDLGVEIDKLTAAIELFEQKLPAEREVEVILKQIWELAAKHKLTPRSVRTDKPVIAASYTELPIKIVLLGDFDGFYSFLLDQEKLRRITQMKEMKLKKSEEDGQVQADLILSIFFDSQTPAAASGANVKG